MEVKYVWSLTSLLFLEYNQIKYIHNPIRSSHLYLLTIHDSIHARHLLTFGHKIAVAYKGLQLFLIYVDQFLSVSFASFTQRFDLEIIHFITTGQPDYPLSNQREKITI